MKILPIFSALVFALVSSTASAQSDGLVSQLEQPSVAKSSISPATGAKLAAGADGVSTLVAIHGSNLVEANKLMPSSPAGIVAVTLLKIGATHYVDKMEPRKRADGLKAITGAFGGAATNNLLLIAGASGPLAIVGGVVAGGYLWHDTSMRLEAEAQDKVQITPLAENVQPAPNAI